MFDLYSKRSLQVIFLARLESGARGAEMIDVDDLLAALIVEDQNKTPEFLEMLGRSGRFIGSTTHQPFLPPDVATSLLESIQRSLPRSESIPTSADMPTSLALQKTLADAGDLRKKLQCKKLTPLHLLAALLAGSHETVQSLRTTGITEETVLALIGREDQQP
jgi:hypothetical protein